MIELCERGWKYIPFDYFLQKFKLFSISFSLQHCGREFGLDSELEEGTDI